MAGCGGSTATATISSQKAETFLRRSLNEKPKSVTCPHGLAIKKGKSFSCKVLFSNGDIGTVTLHETNDTGHVVYNKHDVRVETIGGAAARQGVLVWASGQHISIASVTCPASSPATVGRVISCEAVARSGSKATISVQVANPQGGVRVSAVHPHG